MNSAVCVGISVLIIKLQDAKQVPVSEIWKGQAIKFLIQTPFSKAPLNLLKNEILCFARLFLDVQAHEQKGFLNYVLQWAFSDFWIRQFVHHWTYSVLRYCELFRRYFGCYYFIWTALNIFISSENMSTKKPVKVYQSITMDASWLITVFLFV